MKHLQRIELPVKQELRRVEYNYFTTIYYTDGTERTIRKFYES